MYSSDFVDNGQGLSRKDGRPVLREEAYYGVLGNIVQQISFHSEADPPSLLAQTITWISSAIGPIPKLILGGPIHGLCIFMIIPGPTGEGRKGLAGTLAKQIVQKADPKSFGVIQKSGLVSGQGLIEHLMNLSGVEIVEGDKKSGGPVPAIITETEFGKLIRANQGEGNNLSHVIRQAFDGDTLEQLGRQKNDNHLRVDSYYFSLLCHITPEEQSSEHSRVDQFSGFLGRFIFAYSRSEKILPEGVSPFDLVDLTPEIQLLKERILFAKGIPLVVRGESGRKYWNEELYARLRLATGTDLGEMFARGPVYVMKIAAILALLDGKSEVERAHLSAANAIWDYSVDSVRWQFSRSRFEKVILNALKVRPDGISKSEITKVIFGGNHRSADINEILLRLEVQGLIEKSKVIGKSGRPADVWRLCGTRNY